MRHREQQGYPCHSRLDNGRASSYPVLAVIFWSARQSNAPVAYRSLGVGDQTVLMPVRTTRLLITGLFIEEITKPRARCYILNGDALTLRIRRCINAEVPVAARGKELCNGDLCLFANAP